MMKKRIFVRYLFLAGLIWLLVLTPLPAFSSTDKAPQELPTLEKALILLPKDIRSAITMLEQLLDQDPSSRPIRYNLALAYYEAQSLGTALAYWRQLLFEEALDHRTRHVLTQIAPKNPSSFFMNDRELWLYLPPDLFLALGAFVSAIGLFFLYRGKYQKKYRAFYLWLIPSLLVLGLGLYYFVLRQGSYITLVEDTEIRSAPHKQALPLLRQKSGAFFKVKNHQAGWIQVELSLLQSGWIPSHTCMSLKRTEYFCTPRKN